MVIYPQNLSAPEYRSGTLRTPHYCGLLLVVEKGSTLRFDCVLEFGQDDEHRVEHLAATDLDGTLNDSIELDGVSNGALALLAVRT